jgi:hypothetical protein
MNFPGENEALEKEGFWDLWLETGRHQDGWTWDAQNNRMLYFMVPFDNRRMRLDRA